MRHYENGDEDKILELLNLCFGQWGDIHKWRWLYTQYPGLTHKDIFVDESNNTLTSHRGVHYRYFSINKNHKVLTASLGDTAIHPELRGHGLYSELHRVTLDRAKAKGACLAFTWNLKGSITYEHNRKTGFIDIRQSPSFMKILNPSKILKAGLWGFLNKNPKMSEALLNMKTNLCFGVGGTEFCISELFSTPATSSTKKHTASFVFNAKAIPWLVKFGTMSRLARIRSLALLILTGKVHFKFNSISAFWEVACKGVSILGSL